MHTLPFSCNGIFRYHVQWHHHANMPNLLQHAFGMAMNCWHLVAPLALPNLLQQSVVFPARKLQRTRDSQAARASRATGPIVHVCASVATAKSTPVIGRVEPATVSIGLQQNTQAWRSKREERFGKAIRARCAQRHSPLESCLHRSDFGARFSASAKRHPRCCSAQVKKMSRRPPPPVQSPPACRPVELSSTGAARRCGGRAALRHHCCHRHWTTRQPTAFRPP